LAGDARGAGRDRPADAGAEEHRARAQHRRLARHADHPRALPRGRLRHRQQEAARLLLRHRPAPAAGRLERQRCGADGHQQQHLRAQHRFHRVQFRLPRGRPVRLRGEHVRRRPARAGAAERRTLPRLGPDQRAVLPKTEGEAFMRFTRRRFVQAAGAAIGISSTGISFGQTNPIRLGLMTVKTGPLASGGIDMERALVMYLRERNGALAGRKIELFVGDSGGVPAQARTKIQELVEREHIQVMIGPLATAEALAADDYIRQQQLLTLSVAAAEDMTQRKPNPWFTRGTSTSSQCAQPLADYCYKQLRMRRMAVIADDIPYGHEMCAGFYAAATYVEAAVLEATLNAIQGRVEDKEAFMKTVRGLKVDTARGQVRFDQYGNVVGNVYIRKVERKDGRLVNSVIHTYPDVSQFWTYDPKEFLKNPVYSRDFPPAKNLEP